MSGAPTRTNDLRTQFRDAFSNPMPPAQMPPPIPLGGGGASAYPQFPDNPTIPRMGGGGAYSHQTPPPPQANTPQYGAAPPLSASHQQNANAGGIPRMYLYLMIGAGILAAAVAAYFFYRKFYSSGPSSSGGDKNTTAANQVSQQPLLKPIPAVAQPTAVGTTTASSPVTSRPPVQQPTASNTQSVTTKSANDDPNFTPIPPAAAASASSDQ